MEKCIIIDRRFADCTPYLHAKVRTLDGILVKLFSNGSSPSHIKTLVATPRSEMPKVHCSV